MRNKPGFSQRSCKSIAGVKFYRWSRNGFRGGIKFRGPPYLPVWKAVSPDGREFTLYRSLLSPRQVVVETTLGVARRRLKAMWGRQLVYPSPWGRWEVKSTSHAERVVMKAVRS